MKVETLEQRAARAIGSAVSLMWLKGVRLMVIDAILESAPTLGELGEIASLSRYKISNWQPPRKENLRLAA